MAIDRRWLLTAAGSAFLVSIAKGLAVEPSKAIAEPGTLDAAWTALGEAFYKGLRADGHTNLDTSKKLMVPGKRVYQRKLTKKGLAYVKANWASLVAQAEFLGCLTQRVYLAAANPRDVTEDHLDDARDLFSMAWSSPASSTCPRPNLKVVSSGCVLCTDVPIPPAPGSVPTPRT